MRRVLGCSLIALTLSCGSAFKGDDNAGGSGTGGNAGSSTSGGTTSGKGGKGSTGGSNSGGSSNGGSSNGGSSNGGSSNGGSDAGSSNAGSSNGGSDAGSNNGGSSNGGSGNGGSSTGGSTPGGSGGNGGSGGGAAGGGNGCEASCQWDCCDGECVNFGNDPHNCGGCNESCDASEPFCDYGTCAPRPCNGQIACIPENFCCNMECCGEGSLCCRVPGPTFEVFGCTPPDPRGTCPTGCNQCDCAAPDTPIATPAGERAIAELKVGDLVYSVDGAGVVTVPIVAVQQKPAQDHVVFKVVLADGRVLEISGAHPTADGRTFADLRAGDRLGDVRVVAVSTIPYRHPFTHDILPSSASGAYFAAGALVGSTLAPSSAECR